MAWPSRPSAAIVARRRLDQALAVLDAVKGDVRRERADDAELADAGADVEHGAAALGEQPASLARHDRGRPEARRDAANGLGKGHVERPIGDGAAFAKIRYRLEDGRVDAGRKGFSVHSNGGRSSARQLSGPVAYAEYVVS